MFNKSNGNKKHSFKYSLIAIALGTLPAAATPGGPTPLVVGHKPQFNNSITFTPVAPLTGQTVSVSNSGNIFGFYDKDGDLPATHSVRWLLDNTQVSTAASYLLPNTAQGKFLKVELTPNAQSGDPLVGNPVTSAEVKVLGHAPVASAVTLTPAAPKASQTVTVSWTYTDADNDTQSGTSIAWYLNGVVVPGATAATYTLPGDSAGKTLQARITPRSAAPADPAVGTQVLSTSVTIASNFIGTAIKPSTSLMTWGDADSFCKSVGWRLPTKSELTTIYNNNAGPNWSYPNPGMCTNHGWPLQGYCGGSLSRYWASDFTGYYDGTHYAVDMDGGFTGGTYSSGAVSYVTCVR